MSSPMKTGSKRFGSREHVKGRLDFDGSEMAEMNSGMVTSDENTRSPSEDDAFDLFLPHLDCLGIIHTLALLSLSWLIYTIVTKTEKKPNFLVELGFWCCKNCSWKKSWMVKRW
ncbi:hypothetical protein L2E82_02814 [Cichorium intybus]|uniref:Uncharacterized protein n=1 Tax=Cichorium intybus TaxID=13427 RepID=A0ACB9H2Q3_CICIN|nr:hypothetical protein L2E82_02814 [Cichorium intybus]